nr:hypothetical protein [Tanacetum cinerariifolium]
ESSSSSLNDDVQQSPEEVILPSSNTQSIPINMVPNGDEVSTSHNVFNERLEDAYFDARMMAFKQHSSKLGLHSMTSGQISSGLDLNYAPSTITKQQPTEGELDLLFEAMYDDYFGGQPSATVENVPPAQEPQVRQTSTASTIVAENVPIPTNSSSHATNIPITSQDVDEQ